MTEEQIPKLAGQLVQHQKHFSGLSTKQAQWVIQHPQEAIALFVHAVKNRKQNKQEESKDLLTFVSTVTVQPIARFVAAERFVVNTKKNAPVKISYIWDNFKAWFLGKIEERSGANEDVPGDGPYRTPGDNGDNKSVLRCYTLNRDSVDGPIIADFGGEAKAETALAEIYALMQNQVNSKKGTLLTNGYANIFYVRDVNGVLRAVDVDWFGGGWNVNARSVEDPRRWYAGYRVFSRDS